MASTLTLPTVVPGVTGFSVRSPAWVLAYQGVNITADISAMVTSVKYTDEVSSLSDEVEITVEDRDHRWAGPWFPQRGDVVSLQIGYANEALLDCGAFQIDEVELKGPPDEMTLKCLAAGVTPSIRTPRSRAYENQTLLQIAQTVASAQNMTVTSAPGVSNITFARVTQNQETDLQFLHRISEAHNYDFAVRGQAGAAVRQMIFYSRTQLENQPIVTTLTRSSDAIRTFEFKTKTFHTYQGATVAYQDARTKSLIGAESVDSTAPTGDTLKLVRRCENPQQATLKAESALHTANMTMITCGLEVEGNTLLVAGQNIFVSGFGSTFSGNYFVERSTHKLERSSGYVTSIEARHL